MPTRLTEAARLSATVLDRRILRVLDADRARRDRATSSTSGARAPPSTSWSRADGPLSPRRAAWIVSEVAASMPVAHERRVAARAAGPGERADRPVGLGPDDRLLRRRRAARPARRAAVRGRHRPRRTALLPAHRQVARARALDRAGRAARPRPLVLRPRQVRAGIPRVLDTLCDHVLNPYAAEPAGTGVDLHTARGLAEALREYVGDPTGLIGPRPSTGCAGPGCWPYRSAVRRHPSHRPRPTRNPPSPYRRSTPSCRRWSSRTPPPTPWPSRRCRPSRAPERDLADADHPTRPGRAPADRCTHAARRRPDPGRAADLRRRDRRRLLARPARAAAATPAVRGPARAAAVRARRPATADPVRRAAPRRRPGAHRGVLAVGQDRPQHRQRRHPGHRGRPRRHRRRASRAGRGCGSPAWSPPRCCCCSRSWSPTTSAAAGPRSAAEPDDPTTAPTTQPADEPGRRSPAPRRRDFDPQGDPPEEYPDLAPLAVDGDPRRSWRTQTYFDQFGPGGLKTGVGLYIDLGDEPRGRPRST